MKRFALLSTYVMLLAASTGCCMHGGGWGGGYAPYSGGGNCGCGYNGGYQGGYAPTGVYQGAALTTGTPIYATAPTVGTTALLPINPLPTY